MKSMLVMLLIFLNKNEGLDMQTYSIVDLANIYSRARYVTKGDVEQKVGMAIHITLSSLKKAWTDFGATHTVICLEGRSWRKDFYVPYKLNRTVSKQALTQEEKEEDDLFWAGLSELQEFLNEKTNCTVLQHSDLEADDLISGWIHNHPNDKHIIISSDTDFVQLISDNTSQYDGVNEKLITVDGYFNSQGNPLRDKKTGEILSPPNTKWLLFEKCIRGDKSDNVFSAFPGVRKKGTKNKVGMIDAFADKDTQGYNWNNFMLQRWVDHNQQEHRVLDDYNRNVTLIDLTAQPDNIKHEINQTINNVKPKQVKQVGIHFMKFCSKFGLERISDQAELYSKMLSQKYI